MAYLPYVIFFVPISCCLPPVGQYAQTAWGHTMRGVGSHLPPVVVLSGTQANVTLLSTSGGSVRSNRVGTCHAGCGRSSTSGGGSLRHTGKRHSAVYLRWVSTLKPRGDIPCGVWTVIYLRWWFSQAKDPNAYWRKLKQRLKAEGSEIVTICHGLKLEAAATKYGMELQKHAAELTGEQAMRMAAAGQAFAERHGYTE